MNADRRKQGDPTRPLGGVTYWKWFTLITKVHGDEAGLVNMSWSSDWTPLRKFGLADLEASETRISPLEVVLLTGLI